MLSSADPVERAEARRDRETRSRERGHGDNDHHYKGPIWGDPQHQATNRILLSRRRRTPVTAAPPGVS
jgi:hypothetical protein